MPRLPLNPKLHYSLQNTSNNPLLCILNQTNPSHLHILLINITLPSTPISTKGFLLFKFTGQIFVYFTNFLNACYMPLLFITPLKYLKNILNYETITLLSSFINYASFTIIRNFQYVMHGHGW